MRKTYLIIAVSVLLIAILSLVLIFKFSAKKGESKTASPTQILAPNAQNVSQNEPVVITQIEDEKIKINYFPETKDIQVWIDASSREEFRQKIEKAVKLLKDSGIDTCSKNIFWRTPPNLKNDLKIEDYKLINNLTCPQRTSTATLSAKP